MKRIMIPCDFSESSETALHYALDLASVVKADLILVHINQYPIMTPEVGLSAYTYQDATKDSLDALDKLSTRIKLEHGFTGNIECFSDMGDITTEVLRLGNEKRADLIVMGINSHGSNFIKTVAGSSSVSVAKRSDVPVLVVPPNNTFKKPTTIVYACEMQEKISQEPGYLQVKQFASNFGAEVMALHVIEDQRESASSAEHYTTHNTQDQVRTFVMNEKKASQAILHFVKDHSVDLVAIEPRRHSWLQSLFRRGVTDDVVFHSPVPVLCVHGD